MRLGSKALRLFQFCEQNIRDSLEQCSLEVGKFADFVVIRPPSPVFDAAATIVFSVNNANIDAVYLRGEKRVEWLELTQSDEARTNREVEMRIDRLRSVTAAR